ncbi:microtubule-associated protein futsch [Parasteatoda tepidariorum]|nr:microtubule-associated protein futsch [Parasteatoda tepidariorum]
MEGGSAPFSSDMAPTSSYILVIVSQPVSEADKDNILDRLNRGLLSWDVELTGCDLNGLESVCAGISPKHLEDTDVLIQHSTESLGVEVLVNPTVSTLKQCVRNFLSTSTGHKHLIHAGYTFAGSGSWILQNGTFAFDDFLEIFQQADVQSQKRCNINIHCLEVGRWNSTSFSKDIFTSVANVAFNPPEKVQQVPGSEHLINCLRKVLTSQDLEEMMESSSLVGNIRFNRPTLYMFPAGQGDCALFGINGFNMLIDGGFNRKPCSWEFIRHLDRLDAVLVTRLCENNVCGMSTLMKRKSLNNTYPQIGYVFCNIPENKTPSPKEETPQDNLIVSVVNEGNNFIRTLNELKLEPHQCWRDSAADPFVLYHKVGHGTLEMHVLSPPKDSKEMKEFISEWRSFKETFSSTKSGLKSAVPLSHATSICAVLIWRPTDPKDTITRILFPGSAPQSKIFESLEKLKTLDVLSHPVVTKASLSVTKTVSNKVEKSISKTTIPNRKSTASPALSVNSVASRNGDVHKTDSKDIKKIANNVVKKEVKKEIKKEVISKEKREIKSDGVKKEIKKEAEVKKEVKKIVKKEVKDLKSATEKKSETKTVTKKETVAASKPVAEVKKMTATTVKKSPVAKKDVKPAVTKTAETKKPSASKTADSKAAKDVVSKKVSETKSVAKTKPKPATPTSKTTPKTKPVAVPKPGGKMTKAVAASSVIASAVAVTAAAFELNEKKEEIVIDETEPVASEVKEPEIATQPKEFETVEKPEEDVVVSPLPPEAVSPTPSESVSLTPSDTLSSAPLETVSPTPPLANEPISTEEKEVNEIKDIEQDMPYETEITDEIAEDEPVREETSDFELEKEPDEVLDVADQLTQLQQKSDAMSTSFVAASNDEIPEIEKMETVTTQSAPFETQELKSEEPPTDAFGIEEKPLQKEEGYIIEAHESSVDDQLAQMSMDGSFCTQVKESSVDDQLAQMSMEGSYCADAKEASVDDQLAQMSMEGSYCAEVKEVSDDKLAQMSMEGSYCAGDYTADDEKLEQTHESGKIERDSEEKFESDKDTMHSIQGDEDMKYGQSYEQEDSKFENTEVHVTENASEAMSKSDLCLENKTIVSGYSSTLAKDDLQEDQHYIDDHETKHLIEEQEKDIEPASGLEYGSSVPHKDVDEHSLDEQYDQQPELEALKESISRSANEDYELSRDIINDAEMQETSVDEPEEIHRKESAVSITLNDEELDDNYANELRRKSGTESEDDVDLQQYMMNKEKDNFEQDKLNPRHEQTSDNEDVVKSPTPHAVIDYEESMENLITGQKEKETHDKIVEKELYPSEKDDFDEKDHDSTEDQDIDDGEMIRHPTPPEMKYSEDDMRDPIGPHFITTPGMKAGTDITEQPLYEEAEDEGSDRSASPVVEQPVFGNVGGADFPELVTVSGGTTPSEPQSPKAGLDGKKFGSDAGLMEALSEHDLSESSTHSPHFQDNTAFDLPVATDKYEDSHMVDDNTHMVDDNTHVVDDNTHEERNVVDQDEMKKVEAPTLEKQLSPLTARKICDAPSDDESYSQNEKSETRSEKSDDDDEKSSQRHDDKSDMHDDRSDNQYDGKSDVHDDRSDNQYDNRSDVHDDRSDNQYDAKSDVMDDERKSDIHEDDRYDYHHDDYYDENKSGSHHEMLVSDKHDSYSYEASHGSEIQKSAISYEESEFHSGYQNTEAENKSHIVPDQFASGGIQDEVLRSQTTDELSFHDHGNFDVVGEKDLVYQKQEESFGAQEDNKCNIPLDFQDEIQPPIRDLNTYSQELHADESSNAYESSEHYETKHALYEQRETESSVPLSSYGYAETSNNADIKDFTSASQDYGIDKHEISSNVVDDYEYNEGNLERMVDEHQFGLLKESEIPQPLTDTPSSGISYQETAEVHHYETSNIQEDAYDFHSKQLTQTSAVSEEFETHSQVPETSHFDDTNYNYMSQEPSFTMSQNYETVSKVESTYESNVDQEFSENSNLPHSMTRTDYEKEITESDEVKLRAFSDLGEHHTLNSEFDGGKVDYENMQQELHESKNDFTSEVAYGSNEITSSQFSSTGIGSSVNGNGKEQTSYSHSEQYTSQTASHLQDTAYSQQESNYIISSRFHSDSPEDNVMRSDSSPDVPYPPSSIGAKTSMVVDSQEFMQTKEGYNNMNFPQSGDIPVSPNNKSHNANRDDPYDESSEEDDSSSVPGTVSPYAYTNKAYAKEEEDIDGNHIYKESAFEKRSEILKQMELDPNNPQTLTTQQVGYSQDYEEREYTGSTNYDFKLEEWEKPMGLPTPPDATKAVTKKPPTKPLGKSADSNGKAYFPTAASKMSSPLKKPKPKSTKESGGNPVYVDLAYVPHHGDPHYCDVEFFKKIRARYYVFSGINPSKEVLNALLEAKKTWKEDMEVTIIPTYETDTLGYWMAQNQDDLATYSIEVAPSASRCTVNLQDHETSCAAYRLEF